ncbi:MAG: hypothetical protein ABJC07_11760 [Acidobacteriota bacterium]
MPCVTKTARGREAGSSGLGAAADGAAPGGSGAPTSYVAEWLAAGVGSMAEV